MRMPAGPEETLPIPPGAGGVFVPGRLRELDHTQLFAVLSTEGQGGVHASLIAYSLTDDGAAVVFATPRDSTKYRNLRRTPQVVFLIDSRSNTPADYLGAEAVTIEGTARPLRQGRLRAELAELFLRKHRQLDEFVNAPDTALVIASIERVVHVGHFHTVTEWRPLRG